MDNFSPRPWPRGLTPALTSASGPLPRGASAAAAALGQSLAGKTRGQRSPGAVRLIFTTPFYEERVSSGLIILDSSQSRSKSLKDCGAIYLLANCEHCVYLCCAQYYAKKKNKMAALFGVIWLFMFPHSQTIKQSYGTKSITKRICRREKCVSTICFILMYSVLLFCAWRVGVVLLLYCQCSSILKLD